MALTGDAAASARYGNEGRSSPAKQHSKPWRAMLGVVLVIGAVLVSTRGALLGPPRGTTDYVVGFVTVDSETLGSTIADYLVQEKLAACVNTIPGIESTYWWDGKVNKDRELLLMIKTRRSLVDDVAEAVKKLHTYDEPELITLPIESGLPGYLKWIGASTKAR